MSADTERLRLHDDESDAESTRRPEASTPCEESLVAKTTTVGTYPTSASAYYGVVPQVILGTETEGTAASVTAAVGVFRAHNVGTAVPPEGTVVLVTRVGYRWVFRYDG